VIRLRAPSDTIAATKDKQFADRSDNRPEMGRVGFEQASVVARDGDTPGKR
jgi:hypothetical protein